MVFLQLALDLIEFKKALDIAELAYPYVDIIEAGTPLIKSEGIRVVSELKRRFKDKLVFADLKTMDTGALEAQLAFRAGADIVSVCAQASRDTIRAAVEESRKWGRRVTIDLIGVEEVVCSYRCG
jgi:3-hexulose-6-phosphate synthase